MVLLPAGELVNIPFSFMFARRLLIIYVKSYKGDRTAYKSCQDANLARTSVTIQFHTISETTHQASNSSRDLDDFGKEKD